MSDAHTVRPVGVGNRRPLSVNGKCRVEESQQIASLLPGGSNHGQNALDEAATCL